MNWCDLIGLLHRKRLQVWVLDYADTIFFLMRRFVVIIIANMWKYYERFVIKYISVSLFL